MQENKWGVLAGVLILAYAGVAFGGTNTWTDTGPKGADVRVEFASSPDIVYARGGDKLWKSTDGGQNWTALFSRNAALFPFTVDPTNPNVVITGRGFFNDGIMRTIDGGATFDTQFFSFVTVMKFSGDGTVVYGVNSLSTTTQILRSTDKGGTWTIMAAAGLPVTPVGPGSQQVPTPISLGVERSNSSIVYAGLRHADFQGVYRSTDGGANWTPATGLLGLTVNEIVSHPTVAGRVFIATNVGLFRSNDTGATWNRVTDPSTTGVATIDLQSVAFDRVDPQIIYAGGAQRGEIFFSADSGASWTRRDTGVLANRINTLAPRPGHTGEVLAGTSHTLYRSSDSAQTWAVSANGLYAANITRLQNGSRLRAGLADGGLYESLDGSTWTPANNAALRARMTGGRFSNIVEILEGNRLFVLPFESPLVASATLGASWDPAAQGIPTNSAHTYGGLLNVTGSGPPSHLVSVDYGVYKTYDDGATWIWSGTGLPANAVLTFTKNADGSAVYAGTHTAGLYKSTNGGSSWTAVNNSGLTNLEIKVLAYDTSNDVLLVGTNQGLFASNNGGASYTALTNPWDGAQMSVDAIVVEDFVRGALYVGFQQKVFRSVDSGFTWTELSEGNPYSTSVIRITSMVGDGPGVLYLGNMASGLQTYTVSPDVRVTASLLAGGTLTIGSEVPWQFTVQNAGPNASTFTQAGWQVPANVDVLNLASSRGTCAVSGTRRLSCDFGVLGVNSTATVTMVLRGNAGGTLGINVSAGSAEIDLNASNNTFADNSIRFVESGDLAVTLTATPPLVNTGSPLEYTLVVSNSGTNAVTGGTFETTFDIRDLYVLTQGSAAGCTGIPGIQRCPLPTIAAGASVTYRWTVTPQWGGVRNPTVTVRVDPQNTQDPNPVNNTAAATANVVPVTDLSTSLTSAAPSVLQGSPLALTATVTNNSPIDAAGVTTTLTLGDRMTFSSATGAVCTSTGNVVGCAVGVLGAGASRAITINATTVSPGSATSTFSATSAGLDPVLPNNSANVTVTINPTADLSAALTSASSFPLTGSSFVLTLTVNNLSTNDSTGVRAEVALGATNVAYVSATGATCTNTAASLSCDLGTIAGNSSKVVSITVNALIVGPALFGATIFSDVPDPNTTNGTSTLQMSLIAPPGPPLGGGSSSGGGGGGGSFDLLSLFALLGVLASMQSRRRRAARSPN